MWIDTRDCVPLADGEYMVQTVYSRVTGMNYTHEAGWNTHRDEDGTLHKENAMNDGYVVRWHQMMMPMAVPKEWLEEYMQRKAVSECATE